MGQALRSDLTIFYGFDKCASGFMIVAAVGETAASQIGTEFRKPPFQLPSVEAAEAEAANTW